MKELFNHLAVKLQALDKSFYIMKSDNRIYCASNELGILVKYEFDNHYAAFMGFNFLVKYKNQNIYYALNTFNVDHVFDLIKSYINPIQLTIFDLLAQTVRVEQGGEQSE